jgi:hypothetical protein
MDNRPTNCRFRLREEGKSYPRGGCDACKWTNVSLEACPKADGDPFLELVLKDITKDNEDLWQERDRYRRALERIQGKAELGVKLMVGDTPLSKAVKEAFGILADLAQEALDDRRI